MLLVSLKHNLKRSPHNRAELEKLAVLEAGEISLEEARLCIGDDTGHNNDLVFAAASGHPGQKETFDRSLLEEHMKSGYSCADQTFPIT